MACVKFKIKNKFVTISKEDEDILSQTWTFRLTPQGYVMCTKYNKDEEGFLWRCDIFLHRLIARRAGISPLLGDYFLDHKDRNKLNNTRTNLRPASKNQNARNKSKKSKSYSKYIGVTKTSEASKSCKPWRAYYSVNRKQINLGQFLTQKEAALARDEAVKIAFGEFSVLNFPNG